MKPWGLTETQEQTLSDLCKYGLVKTVAHSQGVPITTIDERMKEIRKKMGKHPSIVLAVKYTTWKVQNEAQTSH